MTIHCVPRTAASRGAEVVLLLGLMMALACSSPTSALEAAQVPDSGAAYVPGDTWRTALPAAAGFDSRRVETLRDAIAGGRYGAVDGVLIVRFGYLVHEQYRGWNPERAHTMQSVSKSVTSLLFGMLQPRVQPGAASLDRPVLDVFNRYAPVDNVDDAKRALTLRHLLTMRTGMDFWEQPYPGSPLEQMNRSTGDWVRYVLDRAMTSPPGSHWSYNSGAAILMGAAIRELAGEPTDAFARRELFDKIGARGAYWVRSAFDGLPHCGGGLYLRPVDLARIGYLVLRGGRWGTEQLVSESWIDSSTAPISRGSELLFSGFGASYGDFWWLFPLWRGGSGTEVIAASGSGGQWLFIVPSLDLVVAVVASNGAGLDLLYDGVLPALR